MQLQLAERRTAPNLLVLLRKALQLDSQAVVRVAMRQNSGLARVWVTTPFGPIGCRTMEISPEAVVRADHVARSLESELAGKPEAGSGAGSGDGFVDDPDDQPLLIEAGADVTISWPGALPPDTGWQLVDYVPATVIRELEQQGQQVAANESGPLGLPPSLLDNTVLTVQGEETPPEDTGKTTPKPQKVELSMREIFALCGLGFIPAQPAESEIVRVSQRGRWKRLDGRFGSLYTQSNLGVLPLG